MKREIKFRTWDRDKKIMTDGFTLSDCSDGYVDKEAIKLSECDVMQYTGLKSKSGVDIYEGDVVTGTRRYSKLPETNKVEWDEKITGFTPFNDYDADCDVYTDAKDCEVIGNIYSNPELLK